MPSDYVMTMFRRDPADQGGQVYALFPALPSDYAGDFCVCYQRVGGHSGANYDHCVATSNPARPEEYRALKQELERLGYKLVVIQRATDTLHVRRREAAAEARRRQGVKS